MQENEQKTAQLKDLLNKSYTALKDQNFEGPVIQEIESA